jgi:hypothetical protein
MPQSSNRLKTFKSRRGCPARYGEAKLPNLIFQRCKEHSALITSIALSPQYAAVHEGCKTLSEVSDE